MSASEPASPAPSPAPTDAGQVLALFDRAFELATGSLELNGVVVGVDGSAFGVRATYNADGSARGSFDLLRGATIEIVAVPDGTVYANATAAFYAAAVAGGDADGLDVSQVAGRWVVVEPDTPAGLPEFARLVDRRAFNRSLQPDTSDGLQLSGPEVVDGVQAYVVAAPGGSQYVVAADGAYLPVKVTTSAGGHFNFSFNAFAIAVTPPPAVAVVAFPA